MAQGRQLGRSPGNGGPRNSFRPMWLLPTNQRRLEQKHDEAHRNPSRRTITGPCKRQADHKRSENPDQNLRFPHGFQKDRGLFSLGEKMVHLGRNGFQDVAFPPGRRAERAGGNVKFEAVRFLQCKVCQQESLCKAENSSVGHRAGRGACAVFPQCGRCCRF